MSNIIEAAKTITSNVLRGRSSLKDDALCKISMEKEDMRGKIAGKFHPLSLCTEGLEQLDKIRIENSLSVEEIETIRQYELMILNELELKLTKIRSNL
jgi:hypothetical protein